MIKYGHKNQEYVDWVEKLVWKHSFMKIHKCIILDILYQLLKEVLSDTHIFQ